MPRSRTKHYSHKMDAALVAWHTECAVVGKYAADVAVDKAMGGEADDGKAAQNEGVALFFADRGKT